MDANEARKLAEQKKRSKLDDAFYRIKTAAAKGFTDTYAPVGLSESEISELEDKGYTVQLVDGKLTIVWS